MSSDILTKYDDKGALLDDTDTSFLDSGNNCDNLLREFHRVDEGLGIAGKWAGGSVTGVCRGWGTSKVRTKLLLFLSWDVVCHDH